MNSKWILLPLIFLCVAAITGTLMRLAVFTNIFLPYINILHSHSHIAFQGWLYLALFVLITKKFLKPELSNSKRYKWQFYATIFILFSILISFLFQGYGLFSIIFSSLFQLLNYIFAFTFVADSRKDDNISVRNKFSLKFIRVSLLFLGLSTLGPWAVAVISANGLANSEYFDAALYFFFHFQYNGWFTFALIGLLLYLAEEKGYQYNHIFANRSIHLLFWSTLLGYSLSLLGMSFAQYLIVPSMIIGLMQLFGLSQFIYCWKSSGIHKIISQNYFLSIAFLCIPLKYVLQCGSTVPYFRELAFFNRPIILAYIHLTMIGFLTFALIAILTEFNWIIKSRGGQLLFIFGFISSEITLVAMGLQAQQTQFQLIVFFSAFMMVGSILIFLKQLFRKSHHKDSNV